MATEPTIMKMRLKEINRIVSGIPTAVRSRGLEDWEAWLERGKTELANALRQELNNLPKGYVKGEKSLKTLAKERYLLWRSNQAKGDWKKLPEAERKVWESYVTDGLEFGTIREKELNREPNHNVFIQYKGTDLCADVYCDCGEHLHVDDYFAYAVQCGECKAIYELPSLVNAVRVESTQFTVKVLEKEED